MTKVFKNAKHVPAFVVAFAVLAVSLFTGVVIKSDAACEESGSLNVVYVGNDMHDENTKNFFYASEHAGTKEDPYRRDTGLAYFLISRSGLLRGGQSYRRGLVWAAAW